MNLLKHQALWAGCISGAAGFLGWFFNLPPEAQTHLIAPVIDLMPVDWRPGFGVWTKLFSWASGTYAIYKASRTGASDTPPKT